MNITQCIAIRLLVVIVLGCALGQHRTVAQITSSRPNGLDADRPAALVLVPTITIVDKTAGVDGEGQEIRQLITALTTLDREDVGISTTMSGEAFAPVPSFGSFTMALLGNHVRGNNGAFRQLIVRGAQALPYLLEALDDNRPTQLEIKHKATGGTMWLGHEIYGNPVNKSELLALKGANRLVESDIAGPYRVCVGDVCFVAIGQITNRAYSAVRYQPTGCIVINSPVHNKRLAADVRAIWGEGDDAQKHFDFLLTDFCTRGGHTDSLQAGAAMRLAYYFPKEASAVIADRLDGLEVLMTDTRKLKEANGVRPADLIEAVAWSKNEQIRRAVLDVFLRAQDDACIVKSMAALGREHDDIVFDKLFRLVQEPHVLNNLDHAHYLLLKPLGERFPDRAKEAFRAYLKEDTVRRRWLLCSTLEETCGAFSIELLGPFLNDKRKAAGTYFVDPERRDVQLPIRVCDAAAMAISKNFPKLTFELRGNHGDLDVQIEVMTRKLKEVEANEP